MSLFKKLSIIVVNYQSQTYLQKCLESLAQFSLTLDTEIIIVNNDERENLRDLAIKYPSVALINAFPNKGFGSACNLGANRSRGDLLFFLNPDTEILTDLKPAMDKFTKDPEIGAIGARLLGEDGRTQEWSAGKEVSLLELIGNNLGWAGSRKIWESPVAKETSWVSGAALFVSQKVFSEIGGFDEKFFMYFEDNDLCRRIRQAGKKIIYLPEVVVRHWGGKSLDDEKDKKKYFYQAQDYYFKKHCGKVQFFWLKLLRKIFLGK